MNAKRSSFDLFVSYDAVSMKMSVVGLVNLLKKTFVLWLDIDEVSNVDDNIERANKITQGLKRSKCLLCILNREYTQSNNCIKEISLANVYKKPVIALMVNDLSLDNLDFLAYFFVDVPVVKAFEDVNFFRNLSGQCFNELIGLLNYVKKNNCTPANCLTMAIERAKLPHLFVDSNLNNDTNTNYSDKHRLIVEPKPVGFSCSKLCTYLTSILCKEHDKTLHDLDMEVAYDASTATISVMKNELPGNGESSGSRQIKATHTFELPSDHLRRCALLHNKKQILICDVKHKSIITIDLDGNVISSTNPNSIFKGPSAICVDTNDKIYVSDWIDDRIFVFNENMKYVRQLDQMVQVDTAFDLAMDNDRQCIYASDTNNNVISVINRFNGHLLRTEQIEKPKDLFVSGQYLYVLNDAPNKPQIVVFDKITFKQMQTIKLSNKYFIRGLHVDLEQSVYVSAYEYDKNGNVDWDSAYLYIFNANGVLSDRIKLNLTGLWDFLVYENRIYFIREKETTHYIVELSMQS
jgi:DNA-binding beta-propeller fold protein YncE